MIENVYCMISLCNELCVVYGLKDGTRLTLPLGMCILCFTVFSPASDFRSVYDVQSSKLATKLSKATFPKVCYIECVDVCNRTRRVHLTPKLIRLHPLQ